MSGPENMEGEAHQQVNQLVDFLAFLHEYRKVARKVSTPEQPFPENDVEHAYEMAMMSWFAADLLGLDLDREKLLKYSLIHDLVEVYADDVFAFDEAARVGKEQREHEALQRIKAERQNIFPDLIDHMERYEEQADEESRFIYALDKILPVITVHLNEGDPFWRHFELSRDDVDRNKRPKIATFPPLVPIWERLLQQLDDSTF